jgi:O-antigen ligase
MQNDQVSPPSAGFSSRRPEIHRKIFIFSAMGTAFFLPVYGRIVPVMIVFMVLNWLAGFFANGPGVKNDGQKSNFNILGFAGFYLLYLAGMAYTSNFNYAWFDLEVKLSLLIFPLIFATTPVGFVTRKELNRILWAFVAGCFLGSVILLIHAALAFFIDHTEGAFFYTRLAWYFHSTFLSIYYNFAIVIMAGWWFLLPEGKSVEKWAITGLIFLFGGMVLLLSSKAGQLTLASIILIMAVIGWFSARRKKLSLWLVGYGLIILLSGLLLAPGLFSRYAAVRKAIAENPRNHRVTAESNADRLVVWSTAVSIIREHWMCGVGTGDVKDELVKGYQERNALPAIQHKYNAHSQYLQTFITLGLPGLLFFILMMAIPAIRAFQKKYWLYLLFLIIFSVNALTESVLEVQAGVVFYAFFNAFLFSSETKEAPVSRSPTE